MGMTLIVVGLGWAVLGVLNLFAGLNKLQSEGFGSTAQGFALIFNMVFFILPGLGLAGVGKLVHRRRRARQVNSPVPLALVTDTISCPFCAETIKAAAKVCRYCQRELPSQAAPALAPEAPESNEQTRTTSGPAPKASRDSSNTLPVPSSQPAPASPESRLQSWWRRANPGRRKPPLGSDQLTASTDRPPTKEAKHISGIARTAILLAGLLGGVVVWWGIMLWAPADSEIHDFAFGLYALSHEGLRMVGIETPDLGAVTKYFLPSRPQTPAKVAAPSAPETGPLLEVQSWRCVKEYRYVFVRGEVKNMSSQPLKNVTAVGEFRTESGELVKSENALLEYDPILPGQTSPFKAGGTGNPQISRCTVSFRYLFGGTVSFTERKKGK